MCYSQTQLSGCFLLVTSMTFAEGLQIGIAQHTTRGVVLFLLIVFKIRNEDF